MFIGTLNKQTVALVWSNGAYIFWRPGGEGTSYRVRSSKILVVKQDQIVPENYDQLDLST